MKKNRLERRAALRGMGATLLAGAFALTGLAAHAQSNYPGDRPISVIVPFAAGGPTDNVARSIGEAMRAKLGTTLVVENKVGAGGTIGTSYVARANPDGYTVLLTHIGFSTAPALYKNPGYDPIAGFEPIGMVVDVPSTVIARDNFPADDVPSFIAYLKANGEKVSIGNAGVGSASHLCGTMLMDSLGVKLLPVPYTGTAPAMNDLLGKQIDIMCDQVTNTTPYIQSNKVKSYAATSLQRVAVLPKLPTLDESGVKGFQVGIWHGMWAPKGTPKPVVDKLVAALQAAVSDPTFQKRMTTLGAIPLPDRANPKALDEQVRGQVKQWGDLFQKVGLQPQ